MKLHSIQIVAAVAAVFAVSACGKKKAKGRVQISSLLALNTATHLTQNAPGDFKALADVSADLPAAAGHFAFAKIDGIKVTVKEIRGKGVGASNPVMTAEFNKEIELTDDPTNPIAFNEEVSWPISDYGGIDLRIANNWKVKAYCKTEGSGGNFTLVYTTTTGVQVQNCSGGCTTLPEDYGYYAYPVLDAYYASNGGNPNLATFYSFSVTEGSSPKVQLLFDPTNTVACWDGENFGDTESTPGGDSIGAFKSYGNSTERAARWPNGTGAFAVPVLPLIAYATLNPDEAAPKSRTFLTATSSTALNTPIDFKATETATILYKADGTPLSGSARNLAGASSASPLEMELEGFTPAEGGTGYDFYASGWYFDGVNTTSFIRNRKLSGFDPPTNSTVFSVTASDGDGCGQTKMNGNGSNASRACSNTSASHYWREVVR